MKSPASRTVSLEGLTLWQADERFLPPHLCSSDNSRRIGHYKKALRIALKTRLTDVQRGHVELFYGQRLTKTEIGKRYGVGSSTACKTLKAAEKSIREYVELYMQIYDLQERERLCEEYEFIELRGE